MNKSPCSIKAINQRKSEVKTCICVSAGARVCLRDTETERETGNCVSVCEEDVGWRKKPR